MAVTQEYSQFGPDESGEVEFEQKPHGPGSSREWGIVLDGTPDALTQVRQLVSLAAKRCGFQDAEIAKIEMAVDEACTNILEHAYHAFGEETDGEAESVKNGPLQIEIHARELPDRLEITILDHSLHDFAVDVHAPENIDSYFSGHKRRGLGLFIIRSFVDDVRHRFIQGRGNELLLVKYFA